MSVRSSVFETYLDLVRATKAFNARMQTVSTDLAAGQTVTYGFFRGLLTDLRAFRDLVAASNVSGIDRVAKAVEGDENYDLVTAFTALLAAVNSAGNSIISNFPTSTNGFIEGETWTWSSPPITLRSFSTDLAPIVAIKNSIDAIIALIPTES